MAEISLKAELGYETKYEIKGLGEGTINFEISGVLKAFSNYKQEGSNTAILTISPTEENGARLEEEYILEAYTAQTEEGQNYKIMRTIRIIVIAA